MSTRMPQMVATDSSTTPVSAAPAAATRRRYGGVLPEERQLQRRTKLLDGALAVFGVKGFHGATVREVCAAAQLTERYFYESFDGMQALFGALYRQLNAQLMAQTVQVVQTTVDQGPVKRMEAALRVFLQFIQEDPRRGRVMLLDVLGIDQSMVQLSEEMVRSYAGLLRMELDRLVAVGTAPVINWGLLADGMIGLNVILAARWMNSGFEAPLDEVVATNLLPYQGLFQLVLSGKTSTA
jgi:AcrR family transcriptional regulator